MCGSDACKHQGRTVSDPFEITYAAHTPTCTFLLDSAGICRRIVVDPGSNKSLQSKGRDAARSAARCVGAQYVAALDPRVSGMLADLPRVGAAMLFACVDERGRVSLVRTGLVTRFETHRAEDPFAEPEQAHCTSVVTSAPMIPPRAPSPKRPSELVPPQAPEKRAQPFAPAALRALRRTGEAVSDPPDDEDDTLDRAKGSPPRPLHPTLSQPPPSVPSEDDFYARVPRRSEPCVARTRTDRSPRAAEPGRRTRTSSYPSLERVATGRRRGER